MKKHDNKRNHCYRYLLPFLIVIGFFLLPMGVFAAGGGYIVTLKDGADVSAAFEQSYDLTQLTKKDHGIYETDAANAAKLEDNPLVASVAKAGSRTLMVTADDEKYVAGNQWALGAVNAAGGWDVTTGSNTVTVVVIDTGFTYGHEDNGNVAAGKDYTTSSTGTLDHGTHGTATAGLLGAATNNNLGIAAACWNVRVVMLSVFYDDKTKDGDVDKRIIPAVYDAVDVYHADVISMSFSGTDTYDAYAAAFQYAYDKGAILVAAAGNSRKDNSPTEYPAGYDEVIGVGAVDSSLVSASYSTANNSVYVAAPGSNILSLTNPDYIKNGERQGENYGSLSGTSLAAPYVAGLAALARSIDPDITTEQFKYYLRNYSTDLETAGYDIDTGYGLINYDTTLRAIQSDIHQAAPVGSGTAADPYRISSAGDLHWLAFTVGGGKSGISAILTGDITVDAATWKAIEGFNGSFDGNGHTVTFNGTSSGGLFATVGSAGTVSNLTVSGSVSAKTGVGLIAAENDGTISDCTTKGSVSGSTAGGVCGENNGTVSRVANQAAVSATSYCGGIAAVTGGGTISYCYNTATVSSTSSSTGGICGYAKDNAVVTSCYNIGAVSGSVVSRGICAKQSQATLSYCFYDSSVIVNGTSSASICAKTADYMKSKGFVSLLNHGNGNFAMDSNTVNGGYPILGSSTLTTSFADVAINDWYTDDVYTLAAQGILKGKSANAFYPGESVTRAEFTAILARAAGADLSAYNGISAFSDVAANQWYNTAVAWAQQNNIVYGVGDNRFNPDAKITRQEIAAIAVRFIEKVSGRDLGSATALSFSDSAAIASWAHESVAVMVDLNILRGYPDNSFGPSLSATRAEAAVIVARILGNLN